MDNAKLSRLALILSGILAVTALAVSTLRSRATDAPPAAAPATAPQGDAAQLIAGLEAKLRTHPEDAEGWRNLGWAFFQTERFAEAASAYQKAAALAPNDAATWSALGEALTLAGPGTVPADAQAAFRRALGIAPKDPRARYFLAVADDLAGKHAQAIDGLFAVLADSSPSDSWYGSVREGIQRIADKNRIDVTARLSAVRPASPAAAAIPGPSPEQMRAASGMAPAQQQAMVDGMVQSLAAKLQADPKNPQGWMMLMRSYATLGRKSEAAAALAKAKAANPQAAADLDAAARTLGI
ncbi:MAG TPA: tetratricopeptide repeat protein [Sphingomonas sp.]|nr:tetratricopeptide repeat protein [Sphingomonas sp.]